MGILLKQARVGAGGEPCDVLISGAEIRAVGAGLSTEEEVVELGGRWIMPGLWDHHVHFDQWSLARSRLALSTAGSAAEVVALVAQRLASEPPEPGTALVGYGFRDGLWPDVPHRALLDAVSGTVPVVLASGDLHCCWVNSLAARHYGRHDHPTGLLRETEWMPIAEDIHKVPTAVGDRLAAQAAEAAAARGVVGIVDLEAPWPLDDWMRRITEGNRSLRVRCGVWASRLEEAIVRGLRTGDVVSGGAGLVEMGPFKVITDGSLNTRSAYCHQPYPGTTDNGMLLVPPDELAGLMRRAKAHGIDSAIHAIGDHANTLALDTFAAVGAHGSIEHAQLLDLADLPRFAELGLTASVQPEHALDDRDVAERHWKGRTERAFAYGALHAAGVRLALGSDAPVAPLDPWISIAAAVLRTRDDRRPWHPEHRIDLETSLSASTRTALRHGEPADLTILDENPYTATASTLRTMPVAGTVLGGEWTWRSGI